MLVPSCVAWISPTGTPGFNASSRPAQYPTAEKSSAVVGVEICQLLAEGPLPAVMRNSRTLWLAASAMYGALSLALLIGRPVLDWPDMSQNSHLPLPPETSPDLTEKAPRFRVEDESAA